LQYKIEKRVMSEQEIINYSRVAEAIEYIKLNFKDQPNLDVLAEKINISPFHFQRIFSEWAGTSPKKFLQFISIEHAKKLLKEQSSSISDTTFQVGLSSTSRLHDMFVSIEGMTPLEYKNGGKSLEINYNFYQTFLGNIIIGSTAKGISYIAFFEDKLKAFELLKVDFPNATFHLKSDNLHTLALGFFNQKNETLKLHLKGSDFQLKVWDALLKIPSGCLSTYGALAHQIDNPNASRAVGTAIGSNPVAFIIPCHRVIQASGNFGGYMWGNTRKTAIIGWESAKKLA
jgi:AraC family transcriptional regulator, regulatory protein of adaptative response / methylated-DNA-[protein]-cysteine methyltransferase